MASRKPAVSTLLKQAHAEIEKLNKELASSKSTNTYNAEQARKSGEEINEIHAFFDALPNSIPRKDENGYSQRSAMTRMAAWLATK